MNLPDRTADTMSDVIAFSSPSGRMSKRARLQAEKRLSQKLFGENGLSQPQPRQPSIQEQIEHLRYLSKLASPRQSKKLLTMATKLETEAA